MTASKRNGVAKPRTPRTHAEVAKRRARNTDAAIRYRLAGASQQEAYTRAFKPRDADKISTAYASKWFAKVGTQERYDQILATLRPTDLDSPPKVMADILENYYQARAEGNRTAAVNSERLRAQIGGMITSNVSVTVEHAMSDDQLISRIAGDDPGMVIALKRKLGTDNSFE